MNLTHMGFHGVSELRIHKSTVTDGIRLFIMRGDKSRVQIDLYDMPPSQIRALLAALPQSDLFGEIRDPWPELDAAPEPAGNVFAPGRARGSGDSDEAA